MAKSQLTLDCINALLPLNTADPTWATFLNTCLDVYREGDKLCVSIKTPSVPAAHINLLTHALNVAVYSYKGVIKKGVSYTNLVYDRLQRIRCDEYTLWWIAVEGSTVIWESPYDNKKIRDVIAN